MPSAVKTKSKLEIPGFVSPKREAEWFDKNRKKLEADMSRRLRRGDTKTIAEALHQSAARERARLKPVTIRMLPDDLALARQLAFEKGLPYQTFIKVLLRESLRRQTRRSR
jgi:predicted DNA binding CopG/RHH family protein